MFYWVNVPVGQTVNVRADISKDSTIVAQLPRGTQVDCTATFGAWKQIIYEDYETIRGFILDDFLSPDRIAFSADVLWIPRYGTTIWKISKHQNKYNTAVKNIQTDLAGLGYSVGKIDGYYGSKTVEGVKAFQRDNGLAVDGAFGDLSKTALWDKLDHRG